MTETVQPPKYDALEPPLLVTLQNLVRDCQEVLGTANGVAGPRLAGMWKDVLDLAPKFMQNDIRGEMLSCAVTAEYWDLPPQVRSKLERLGIPC